MRDEKQLLRDILKSISAIQKYTSLGQHRFKSDELIQTWVVRHLEVIGEAARKLPDQSRADMPDVPWKNIIGMRNHLIHAYFHIDIVIVWEAVEHDLPVLKQQIADYLGDVFQ